jgi:capsular exopolysaccharide synthesis family protein
MALKKNNGVIERKVFLVNEETTPFAITEAFRKAIANIGFAIPKKEDGIGKVFCVTSSLAGEGKTTLAVNMAITAAKSGAKTILIDCDMRNPSVRKYFPKCNTRGIVDYLSGKNKLEDVICKNIEENLDLVVARQSPPNPIVLINSETFDNMILELSKQYEYVIVDTPPVGLVSDASIIGKKLDGVVVVTRHEYSNHKVLKKVLEQLKFAQCNILGFILNDFAFSLGGYYGGKYGKKGYYGYKYGYGNSSHKDSESSTTDKSN